MANLIENAVFHGGAPAKIKVTTGLRDGQTVLSVADHGRGVPVAERENILRRFYRINPGDLRPGSGLGLAMVAARDQGSRGSAAPFRQCARAGGGDHASIGALVLSASLILIGGPGVVS